MRQRRKNSPSGAFTLAEILVMVVILALIAAMVIPNVVSTSDLQVIAAARMIAADLQYAQSVAITSQTPVTVTFDVVHESYALSNASGALIHPITKKAYTVDFASQEGFGRLNIVSAAFGGGAAVTFDELGAANSAGTVTLQAGSHVYQVSVAAATGKVTVTSVGS